MRRHVVRHTLLGLIATALVCATSLAGTPGDTEHVACRASLSASTFRRGDTGEIRIVLTPAAGIHVNGSPLPSLRLAPGAVAVAQGAVDAAVNARGYLTGDSTVVQRIGIRKDAPRGTHVLRGTITYYYCSDTEGWCMRSQQALELSLTITR
jgi:hypothetical protein